MRFGILGPVEVADRDRIVDLGAPRQRAVIALLTIHANTVVSLDRLIDELWGDAVPSAATGSLQAYISNLRRVLEPNRAKGAAPTVLVTRAPGYLLSVAAQDIEHICFERLLAEARVARTSRRAADAVALLDRALALWRGEPLADFAFDSFATPEIGRLNEMRVAASELRLDALLELGEHPTVIAELDQLIAAHPTRERLRVLSMIALYRSGRQAEALRAFEDARVLLGEELGLEPGPEMRDVQRAILDHDRVLLVPAEVATFEPAASTGATASPEVGEAARTGDDSFVGREAILDSLLSLLDAARTGRARVALIGGEPGIGKTHLMVEFARLAASRGWSVAWGRSFEGADAPPLWPWVHVIREIGVAGLDLPAHVLTPLASLLPEIDAEHGELAGEGAAFRLFDAIRALMAAASRRQPVLVVLDDLQWADPSTLRLLRFLVAECADDAVVFAATFHEPPDAAPGSYGAVVSDLARLRESERIELTGLSIVDVRHLLATVGTFDDQALDGARPSDPRTHGRQHVLRRRVGPPARQRASTRRCSHGVDPNRRRRGRATTLPAPPRGRAGAPPGGSGDRS